MYMNENIVTTYISLIISAGTDTCEDTMLTPLAIWLLITVLLLLLLIVVSIIIATLRNVMFCKTTKGKLVIHHGGSAILLMTLISLLSPTPKSHAL